MKKIAFPFIVLLLFVFVSCEEEEPENVNYLGEYKNYVPFEGGEKVHYRVNDSEKIVLSVTEKKTSIISWIGGSKIEKLTMKLTDPTGFSVFYFELSAGGEFSLEPAIRLSYNYIIEEDPLSQWHSSFFLHNIVPPLDYEYTPKILESLTVRNKTYHNVVEIRGINSYDKLYYCESDGIINFQCKRTWFYGVERQDSITFELEKIEWN